jgi:hypothetical protein
MARSEPCEILPPAIHIFPMLAGLSPEQAIPTRIAELKARRVDLRPWALRNARTIWIGRVRENNTMVDRVQITRLDESIPRWQIRDLKVSTSQLRYALRASEEQIQEAVKLKPGQQMFIDLYLGGV